MPLSSLHSLLLLSDSALPLGSFAFSSGLESFLAHAKHSSTAKPTTTTAHNNSHLNSHNSQSQLPAFHAFLHNSLANLSSTALPYVRSAYQDPSKLETLDNDFDASTPCTVARRASVAQGKALLTLWERAFSTSVGANSLAASTLQTIATAVKISAPDAQGLQHLNAHFAPLFGTVCAALGLSIEETLYLFLLSHAKAVLSAAVRASVLGPYQSQGILAGDDLQRWIAECLEREGERKVEDAGVSVPVMDLWMGRHELLYSRIFNS